MPIQEIGMDIEISGWVNLLGNSGGLCYMTKLISPMLIIEIECLSMTLPMPMPISKTPEIYIIGIFFGNKKDMRLLYSDINERDAEYKKLRDLRMRLLRVIQSQRENDRGNSYDM